jgi:predicted peptidase
MTLLHGLVALVGGILIFVSSAGADDTANDNSRSWAIPYLERWDVRVYQNEKGETLPYRLLRPKDYDAKRAYPLVVFLHGMGERGSDNKAQLGGMSELFASDATMERYPAIVIAPQCPKGEDKSISSWSNWDPGGAPITRPTRLVLEIVEAVRHEFSIDSDRMYIGGLSMGGFGTWNVIQEYPDLFAAAFPMCGGGDPSKAARLTALSLWVFHGAKDNVVPPQRSREMVQAIQAAGGHPGFTEYPDVGHDSWNCALWEPRLLPWLFAQKREHAAAP